MPRFRLDFLELNSQRRPRAAAAQCRATDPAALPSAGDEAVRRQRGVFSRSAGYAFSDTFPKSKSRIQGQGLSERFWLMKKAQQRAAADGASAGGVFRAMGMAGADDYEDVSRRRLAAALSRFLSGLRHDGARSAWYLFCLADRCALRRRAMAAACRTVPQSSLFGYAVLSDGACRQRVEHERRS